MQPRLTSVQITEHVEPDPGHWMGDRRVSCQPQLSRRQHDGGKLALPPPKCRASVPLKANVDLRSTAVDSAFCSAKPDHEHL